jgi:glycosyltransferase involved in cell wall biosynthesis
MKIAYVTTFDSSNEHAWSGSGHYMFKAMQRSGCSVETVGNLKIHLDGLFKLKKAYYKFLMGKNYQKQREPAIVRSYGKQLSERLKHHSYDLILSPGTIPVAYLKTAKPIVFWTDATFASMLNFFPDFSNLPEESIAHGNEMEQAALENCALAIYTSSWAANSAIKHYKVNPSKVKVVPFGANIPRYPSDQDILRIIRNKTFDKCRLLFIGVDWHRKGGDTAIKVAEQLNKDGVRTEIHLIGSSPAKALPDFVVAHGFITKDRMDEIDQLFEQSHFLILPSIADCVPVVFAEANAYGLPCVATNVGGIQSAITNGVNGQTFDLNADVSQYSKYIADLFSSPEKYREMNLHTYAEFKNNLNWDAAGKNVKSLIDQL